MRRLQIDPERSTVVIEARSTVGPIAWEGTGPVGEFAFAAQDAQVRTDPPPQGWLELRLDALTSGNVVYDSELLRRVNAHRYPIARVELADLVPGPKSGTFLAAGRLTFHGVTRPLSGQLELEIRDDGSVQVTGENEVDIREFGLPPPTLGMLKVYPEVRVYLIIEGTPAS